MQCYQHYVTFCVLGYKKSPALGCLERKRKQGSSLNGFIEIKRNVWKVEQILDKAEQFWSKVERIWSKFELQ